MTAAERLATERSDVARLLGLAHAEAAAFLDGLDERPAGPSPARVPFAPLEAEGVGTDEALRRFRARFGPGLSGSAGPRSTSAS